MQPVWARVAVRKHIRLAEPGGTPACRVNDYRNPDGPIEETSGGARHASRDRSSPRWHSTPVTFRPGWRPNGSAKGLASYVGSTKQQAVLTGSTRLDDRFPFRQESGIFLHCGGSYGLSGFGRAGGPLGHPGSLGNKGRIFGQTTGQIFATGTEIVPTRDPTPKPLQAAISILS
jgi:hypothetical protein